MFGDLMGNMKEKQKAMREKLAGVMIDAEAGAGAVKVLANANKEIVNISIDPQKLDLSDMEQLEDLLLVAINRVIELAAVKEQEEAQNMVKDIFPPGMGDLSDMLG